MKILSVNVSRPKTIPYLDSAVTTGIFKQPVAGRVLLGRINLEGDEQADLSVHGGVYQAVYAYPFEHYDSWQRELGRDDFTYGQFGENLTVTGMLESEVHIGDSFRLGEALVQVTQPRVPCYKLALKMNLPRFPKLFMVSARTGFYLRVLEEGEIEAGDEIEKVAGDPEQMSVEAVFRLAYCDQKNREELVKALRIPGLSPGWRGMFEEQLSAVR
jgi:MOSC domain-containing protein YiiM